MSVPDYRRSRFDTIDEEPMGPLANLADIMLVFAVGLMVALAASQGAKPTGGMDVNAGRELPEMPAGVGETGSGYESVGRVYRDSQSGRLILIDDGAKP
ncbi:DUF2149 domain-containing protein [Vreelandella massiliensis]|uniref:DUF2149 domain-containing protein n=1 Tax=Vreelandella massiliensis TaxID=1816686 RepID=UPI00096A4FB1|nr:DUF2149 domain-containing protein [Halomonas massiliensis]